MLQSVELGGSGAEFAGSVAAVIVQSQISLGSSVDPGVEKRLLKFLPVPALTLVSKRPPEANSDKSNRVFVLETNLIPPDSCRTEGSASATNPVREVCSRMTV